MAGSSGINTKIPIQSTAGAIPMKNDKGELYMQKVKVARYVTGKRPDYAPADSSDSDEDYEFGIKSKKPAIITDVAMEGDHTDARLRRLQTRQAEEDEEDDDREERMRRHRRLHEPEVLGHSDDEESEEEVAKMIENSDDEEDEEEELDEEEIERRRAVLRQRAKQRDEEVMDKEEEKSEGSEDEESSEYEEYTDSEEEETGPRLKPVFVRKKDRITIQEKEREAQRQKQLEQEAKKMAEDRRRQTLRMVEQEVRKETEKEKTAEEMLGDIDTDDDNDEEEYEAWKIRELKRIKRDREERETIEKERLEIERMHNMTEEERRNELKQNPKQVTNKASKGKYKFLQKYYHRGAFYLDEEDTIFKRDFSSATLEDHFDKTILPKVMQVKNFGRSGRTKYTHLVDQDTTQFDSPWNDTALSHKFHTTKGGGMKQDFERPSEKKKK